MSQNNQQPSQEIPLEFTGTATQYFGIWIVNLLLVIITLGVYLPWAKVRTHRYFYANTLLNGAPFDYLASPVVILKGWAIAAVALIIYSVITNIYPASSMLFLPIIMIATPWVLVRSMRFRLRNTAYHNIRFGFNSAYREAAIVFIGWLLLAIVTLGFAYPRFVFEANRFMITNSSYGTTRFDFHASTKDFYNIYLRVGIATAILLLVLIAALFPKIKEGIETYQAAKTAAEQPAVATDATTAETEPTLVDSGATVIDNETPVLLNPENTIPADVITPIETTATDVTSTAEGMSPLPEASLPAPEAQTTITVEAPSLPEPIDVASIDTAVTSESADLSTATVDAATIDTTAPAGDAANEMPAEEQPAPVTVPDANTKSKADMEKYALVGVTVFFALFIFYMAAFVYIAARTTNLVYNQTEIAGHRFLSTIRARDLAWLYFSNLVVVFISFGLMIPWTKIRMARYRANKLVFLSSGNMDNFMQAEADKISALGEEIGDAFDIDFAI